MIILAKGALAIEWVGRVVVLLTVGSNCSCVQGTDNSANEDTINFGWNLRDVCRDWKEGWVVTKFEFSITCGRVVSRYDIAA
jgi:hypothetical protein